MRGVAKAPSDLSERRGKAQGEGQACPPGRAGLGVPKHSRTQCPQAQHRVTARGAGAENVHYSDSRKQTVLTGHGGPWARGLLSGPCSSRVGMGRNQEQFFSRWAEKSIKSSPCGLIRSAGAFPAPRTVGSPPGRGGLAQSRSLPPCQRKTCVLGVGTLCHCCSSWCC